MINKYLDKICTHTCNVYMYILDINVEIDIDINIGIDIDSHMWNQEAAQG